MKSSVSIRGKVIPAHEAVETALSSEYVYQAADGTTIDAGWTDDYGGFVNDALSIFMDNARVVCYAGKLYLEAIEDINQYDEIYLPYDEYWKTIYNTLSNRMKQQVQQRYRFVYFYFLLKKSLSIKLQT